MLLEDISSKLNLHDETDFLFPRVAYSMDIIPLCVFLPKMLYAQEIPMPTHALKALCTLPVNKWTALAISLGNRGTERMRGNNQQPSFWSGDPHKQPPTTSEIIWSGRFAAATLINCIAKRNFVLRVVVKAELVCTVQAFSVCIRSLQPSKSILGFATLCHASDIQHQDSENEAPVKTFKPTRPKVPELADLPPLNCKLSFPQPLQSL